ncbi:PREDICTED: acyl-CoA-binding domain-containing protein 4-like [Ipomoea nil]|uniref:acyl-CoA-binding domain-containing protein 4-like n=1 Tax=Ipomoea nil TaxID=35883 RepID=UPI000900A9C1|nr:PREDICTED: acyl-CoA-binding domain-containing protein 4-like [Ipomoea nil]
MVEIPVLLFIMLQMQPEIWNQNIETSQERKISEIVMDNDSQPMVKKVEETSEHLLSALKAEKEELESSLNKEKLQMLQLKQELADAETRKFMNMVRGEWWLLAPFPSLFSLLRVSQKITICRRS